MAIFAGSRLGPYEVVAPLGAGGMGEVYRARDPRLGRDVAIKVITSDSEPSAERLRRFMDEARAVGALNHPNILAVFDVGSDGGLPYVVFELLEGETLRTRLLEGPLPHRNAVEYAVQVCQGLAASHEKGILHRDLKPENLFLTGDGRVKILDFGLAKLVGGLDESDGTVDKTTRTATHPGLQIGTLIYMSPEQVRGRPADRRSDIFALGVVLHEMLSGSPPFRRGSDADTIAAILNEDPPELSPGGRMLSPSLVGIVRRCLEKEPADRFQGARDLAFALTQVLSGAEQVWALARSGPVIERARLAERRLALRWPAMAAAAFITLAALYRIPAIRRVFVPRPITVLVSEPRAASSPQDEQSRFAAFALKEALLRALTGLEGVEPIGPDELPEGTLSIRDAARAAAADEVIVSTIACQGPSCQISLRRSRGDDAHVIRDSGSFEVSSDPENSLVLAKVVAIHVHDVFPAQPPRSVSERLDVQKADYLRYLTLQRRTEAGEVLGRPEVDALEQIAQSSPGLAEAYILGAGTARGLGDRSRAQRILQKAEGRHHDDPRLVYERFLLELDTGKIADAEAALAELERLVPGDIWVWRARARLKNRQGNLQEAADARREMVRARPSWRTLWYVADAEIEQADAQGARRHLDQLLQLSPGNRRGLEKSAELEWLLGDPNKAARIYEGLLEEKVTWEDLSNLGWSLVLAGNYTAAATSIRRSLELKPDDLPTRFNLATAHEGLGNTEEARRVYRDVLERIGDREGQGALTVWDRLIKAQSLARLGDSVSAVDLTIHALAEGDRDPQVLFQAALIYALCGDKNNAIVWAREARRRLSPRWFTVPGFESVRGAPAFRELLGPA